MIQQVNPGGEKSRMSVERRGDRELVVTRTFDAPPSTVYRAWTQPELFQRWWMPKSISGVSLVSCDMDVRTGGKYRLEFSAGGSDTMAFYGKYLEVVPNERIVWTNDEGEAGAKSHGCPREMSAVLRRRGRSCALFSIRGGVGRRGMGSAQFG